MWEIILLGLILMVIGVLLPNLMPVGMVLLRSRVAHGVGAKARDLRVAYPASREGLRDIVFVPTWFTNCEVFRSYLRCEAGSMR